MKIRGGGGVDGETQDENYVTTTMGEEGRTRTPGGKKDDENLGTSRRGRDKKEKKINKNKPFLPSSPSPILLYHRPPPGRKRPSENTFSLVRRRRMECRRRSHSERLKIWKYLSRTRSVFSDA